MVSSMAGALGGNHSQGRSGVTGKSVLIGTAGWNMGCLFPQCPPAFAGRFLSVKVPKKVWEITSLKFMGGVCALSGRNAVDQQFSNF